MIYNGLEAKMVSYKMVGIVNGNGISQAYDLEKTLLADKFGVVTVEGIIVANEYASLASASKDAHKDAGETQIAVTGDEGISGTYKVATTLDMLGQSVTMYIKYKNAGSDKDATVFGVPTLSTSNQIVVTTDGSTPATAAKDNDIAVASNAQYFKNFEKVTNLDDVKQGGKLTLVDNDNDDEAEYAIYVEYTAGAVTAKNTVDDGYLDVNGCVLAVGQPADSNLQYAVILGGTDDNGMDPARVKLLLADGTIARYTVDKLDGETADGTPSVENKEGTIVSYTVGKNDTLKLTTKGTAFGAGAATDATAVAFEKGKVRLNVDHTSAADKSYTVTNDTVFLYYNGDKVSRFVGKNSAPDLTIAKNGTEIKMAVATRGVNSTVATVVYVGQKAEGSFDGNYIYLYDAKVTANSDGYEATAVVNGEKKTVTIDNFAASALESTTLLKDATLGLYAFSVEDDVYTLSAKSANADGNVVIEDTVAEVGRDYVLVTTGVGTPTKKEFILNNDTITVSVEDKKLTTGVSISDGDEVTLVFNDDDEVLYAYVTEHTDAPSTGGSISAAIDSIVMNAAGSGSVDVVVTLKENLAANNTAAISIQLERSVDDGKTWRAIGAPDVSGSIASNAKTDTVTLNNAPASDTNLYRATVTVTVTDSKNTPETTDDVVVEIATKYVTNEVLSY